MPTGTMQIEVCRDLFANPDPNAAQHQTICIVCRFPSGVQKEYHPFPLRRYIAATFVTYLPDDTAGRDVLERLKYAFAYGHLFTLPCTSTGGIAPILSANACHPMDPHDPYSSHTAFTPFPIHDAGTSNPTKNSEPNEYVMRIHADLDGLGIPTVDQLWSSAGNI